MNGDEPSQFDTYESEIAELDTKIERAEKVEKMKRLSAPVSMSVQSEITENDAKDIRKWSISKAIRSQLGGEALDGIEGELHQEAQKEARESGIVLEGIGVPQSLMRADQVAGTDANGGELVATDLGQIIPALRPRLMVEALGAQRLEGLVGNFDLPTQATVSSSTHEGETDANAQSDATYADINMSPNRVGAYSVYSKQLLRQANLSIDAFIADDLQRAQSTKIDEMAINGSGSSNEPTGILSWSGIGDVAGGTNGLAPTWAHIVDLETEITQDNADMGALAYLTTPGIKGYLKQTLADAGSGQYHVGS